MFLAILLLEIAGLALVALVLLIVARVVGGLETLEAQVASVEKALSAVRADEVAYLQAQNKDLHERLLALTAPGAQARLATQRIEPWRGPATKELVDAPFPRPRSAVVVDLPPSPPEPEP